MVVNAICNQAGNEDFRKVDHKVHQSLVSSCLTLAFAVLMLPGLVSESVGEC